MAIYLIVAQPRHGKSQFVVKTAHELHEKNLAIQKRLDAGKADPEKDLVRKIYSDIEGHAEKTDYIELAPPDWRDVPHNSIVIMDEIHKRPEFCDNDGKMSQHPMIVDLTTHGHQNKDIYLITQDPERLNKGIRKLVEKMYLVKRPIQKPPFATIYEFERWLRDPWQAAASTRTKSYQDSYKFFYKKKWQDMYTSASAHTSINFKIQNKFWYALIAIAVLSYSSYWLFMKSGGDKLARTAVSGMTGEKPEQAPVDKKTEELQAKVKACQEQFKWTEQQCLDAYDPKQMNERNAKLEQSTGNSMNQVVIDYNPNKPFDTQYTAQAQPTDFPKFAGCMKKGTRYVAYTQQGTILHDVSQSDCRRVVEDGDRPFDYFKQPVQVNNNAQLPDQNDNQKSDQSSVLKMAKMEQAKQEGLI